MSDDWIGDKETIERIANIKRQTADEMFEKLGYKLVSNKRFSVYQKEVEYTQGSQIDSITIDWALYARFKKERLEIGYAMTKINPEFITKEEFEAIQNKILEKRQEYEAERKKEKKR